MSTLETITILVSGLAACLAWLAKILWAKDHIRATEQIFKSKDAEIAALQRQNDHLRELTPMKIREYFVSVKEQLTEYIDKLKADLASKESEILALTKEKESLATSNEREISELQIEKTRLEKQLETLQRDAEKIDSNEAKDILKRYYDLANTVPAPIHHHYPTAA